MKNRPYAFRVELVVQFDFKVQQWANWVIKHHMCSRFWWHMIDSLSPSQYYAFVGAQNFQLSLLLFEMQKRSVRKVFFWSRKTSQSSIYVIGWGTLGYHLLAAQIFTAQTPWLAKLINPQETRHYMPNSPLCSLSWKKRHLPLANHFRSVNVYCTSQKEDCKNIYRPITSWT